MMGQAALAAGTRPWPAGQLRPGATQATGLWVFIGVATTLFSLFIVAYVMRMSERDATAIAMPWQLWLSTAWLLAGGVLLQRASLQMASDGGGRGLFLAGGACALAFIVVQWWAWQAMLDRRVSLQGGPAGSFFYLLTAMHALHVAGGLVAWWVTLRSWPRLGAAINPDWRPALCARYWHFLLLVWLALFAVQALITPELASLLCGRRASP